MSKKISFLFILVSFPAFSQTVGDVHSRLAEIEKSIYLMQQENLLLQAKIQNQEVLKKFKQYTEEDIGVLPFIVSIQRVDDVWMTKLQNADGGISIYTINDVPQKNVRIIYIGPSGVTVEVNQNKKKIRQPLSFKVPESNKNTNIGGLINPPSLWNNSQQITLPPSASSMQPISGYSPALNTPLPQR